MQILNLMRTSPSIYKRPSKSQSQKHKSFGNDEITVQLARMAMDSSNSDSVIAIRMRREGLIYSKGSKF